MGAVENTASETLPASDGLRLTCYLARPPSQSGAQAGLVLCHGMPIGAGEARTALATFPELAERIARDAGWSCLTFSFRGAGTSPGEFSIAGWLADLRAAADHLRALGMERVWLAGFSTGGTLALRVAADDPSIRGVAALAAPAELSAWIADPSYLLGLARRVGVISAGTEPDLASWANEVAALDPLGAAARIPPRPLLFVHGSADETVPMADARALADAAGGACELHMIPVAGHRLRTDPRAIAILLGWLERQTM